MGMGGGSRDDDEKTATDHFRRGKASLESLIEQAKQKFAEAVRASTPSGSSSANPADIDGNAQAALDWLGVAAVGVLSEVSEAHAQSARAQLKMQKTALDMKLDTARRGSRVQLQNTMSELEATHKVQMKEKFAALLEGGDSALKDAHRQIQAKTGELEDWKLKFEGLESAMSMAQQRLKAAEYRVTDLEAKQEVAMQVAARVAACHEELDGELGALKLKKAHGEKPIDEKVHAVLDAHAAGIAELRAARTHIGDACSAAGVALPGGADGALEGSIDFLIALQAEEKAQAQDARSEAAAVQALADSLTADRDGLAEQLASLQQAKAAGEARLNAEVERLSGQLALGDERVHVATRELREQLDAAKQTLSSSEARLASTQGELAHTTSRLESAHAEVARLTSAQDQIRVLEGRVAAINASLDQTLGQLKLATSAKESLETKVGRLAEEINSKRRELADEQERCAGVERKLERAREEVASSKQALQEILDAGGDEGARAEAMVSHWRSEAQKREAELQATATRLEQAMSELNVTTTANSTLEDQVTQLLKDYAKSKSEMKRCKTMLDVTLSKLQIHTDKSLTLEERLTDILQEYTSCQKEAYAAVHPRAAHKEAAKTSSGGGTSRRLPALLSTLVDKYHALRYSLEQSQRHADASSARVLELTSSLDASEHGASTRLRQVQEAAKVERDRLIKAALGSLQQLRTHLTQTLAGYKDASHAYAHEEFVWNPFKDRWGVLSNGKFDHMLVRVEALAPSSAPPTAPSPPPKTSGGQCSSSLSPFRAMRLSREKTSSEEIASVPHPPAALVDRLVVDVGEEDDARPPRMASPTPPQQQAAQVRRPKPKHLDPLADKAEETLRQNQIRHLMSKSPRSLKSLYVPPKTASPRLHGSALTQAAVSARGAPQGPPPYDFDCTVAGVRATTAPLTAPAPRGSTPRFSGHRWGHQ